MKDSATIPWLYGNASNPEGDYCKICYNSFRLGGFLEEHGSISKFIAKTKKMVVDTCFLKSSWVPEALLGRCAFHIWCWATGNTHHMSPST
eukprot:1664271-Alexandrium_andersonii.AAC.1